MVKSKRSYSFCLVKMLRKIILLDFSVWLRQYISLSNNQELAQYRQYYCNILQKYRTFFVALFSA